MGTKQYIIRMLHSDDKRPSNVFPQIIDEIPQYGDKTTHYYRVLLNSDKCETFERAMDADDDVVTYQECESEP